VQNIVYTVFIVYCTVYRMEFKIEDEIGKTAGDNLKPNKWGHRLHNDIGRLQ
jgi:hypothetical protein